MSKNIITDIAGKGTEIKKEFSQGIERTEPSIINLEARTVSLETNGRIEYEHDSTTGAHPRADAYQDGLLTKEDWLGFSKTSGSISKRQAIQSAPVWDATFGHPMFAQADFIDASLTIVPIPLENYITEQYTMKSTDNGTTSMIGDIADSTACVSPLVGSLVWQDVGEGGFGNTAGFEPGPGTNGYCNCAARRTLYIPNEALPSLVPSTVDDPGSTSVVNTSFTVQMWTWHNRFNTGVDIYWQLGGFKEDGLSIGYASNTIGDANVANSFFMVGRGNNVRKSAHKTYVDTVAALGFSMENRWVLHTVTYDVNTESVKWYINTTLIAEIDMSDGWRFTLGKWQDRLLVPTEPIGTIDSPDADSLVLTQENLGTSRPLNGYWQLFRTYDQFVLSAQQVALIYTQDYAKLNTNFSGTGNIVIGTKNLTLSNPLVVSMAQGFVGAIPKDLNKVFTNNFQIAEIQTGEVVANGDGAKYYVYLDYTSGNLTTNAIFGKYPPYEPMEPMWWAPRLNHPFFNTTKMKMYDATSRAEITRIYLGEVIYRYNGGVPYLDVNCYRPKGEGIVVLNWKPSVNGIVLKLKHNTGMVWESLHQRFSIAADNDVSNTAHMRGLIFDIYPDHNTEATSTSALNFAFSNQSADRLTEYTMNFEDAGQMVNGIVNGTYGSVYSGTIFYRFSRIW